MAVGSAKFDQNRCNESPLRGEKPDFWPVSKNNTGSLPLRGILPVINKQITNHSIFISVRSKPTETVEKNRLYNNTIERLIRIDNEL